MTGNVKPKIPLWLKLAKVVYVALSCLFLWWIAGLIDGQSQNVFYTRIVIVVVFIAWMYQPWWPRPAKKSGADT